MQQSAEMHAILPSDLMTAVAQPASQISEGAQITVADLSS